MLKVVLLFQSLLVITVYTEKIPQNIFSLEVDFIFQNFIKKFYCETSAKNYENLPQILEKKYQKCINSL